MSNLLTIIISFSLHSFLDLSDWNHLLEEEAFGALAFQLICLDLTFTSSWNPFLLFCFFSHSDLFLLRSCDLSIYSFQIQSFYNFQFLLHLQNCQRSPPLIHWNEILQLLLLLRVRSRFHQVREVLIRLGLTKCHFLQECSSESW